MKKNVILVIILVNLIFAVQEWENISPFPDDNGGVAGDFISEKQGWVYSGNNLSKSSIYHTSDGGMNWEEICVLEDSLESFTGVEMIDSLNGWGTKIWQNNQRNYSEIICKIAVFSSLEGAL